MQSVKAQTFQGFECIVIDNASTDGSRDWLIDNYGGAEEPQFQLILAEKNLGFAAANNLAARQAKGTWLALLNPDAFAHPDWLENLRETARTDNRVTMVGSTQYMALHEGVFDGIGDEYHVFGLAYRAGFNHPVYPIKTRETFAPCGAGAFLDKDAFWKAGGFDENFFCYHEDIDLAYRMRLLGGICLQSSDAKIDHVSSGISGRASAFAVYHGTRNRTWTFLKNTPRGLLFFLFPWHALMSLALLGWATFRPGRFRPTLKGMVEGFFTRPINPMPRVKRQISYFDLLFTFAWSPLKVVRRKAVKSRTADKSDLRNDF